MVIDNGSKANTSFFYGNFLRPVSDTSVVIPIFKGYGTTINNSIISF